MMTPHPTPVVSLAHGGYEFQVRLEAVGDLAGVIPPDLHAVMGIVVVADHNAGRFPPAQTHVGAGAQRLLGRVGPITHGWLGRLTHGTRSHAYTHTKAKR